MKPDMEVVFGRRTNLGYTVAVEECLAFPGQGVPNGCHSYRDARIHFFGTSVEFPLLGCSNSEQLRDLVLLVLSERVDAHPTTGTTRTGNFDAIPSGFATSTSGPAAGPAVGYGLDETGTRASVRQTIQVTWEFENEAGMTLDPASGMGQATDMGDSGGPTYTSGPTAPRVVAGVHSQADCDVAIGVPPVVSWLSSNTSASAVSPAGRYLGPTDVPLDTEPERTSAHDAQDPDGDGLVGSHDGCPNDRNPSQADTDGDGVQDACDVCPNDRATGRDADADGIPDECDLCPLLDVVTEDSDSDGIGDACDNCSDFTSPNQHNCNYDAEYAIWQQNCPGSAEDDPTCPLSDYVYGDVCDIVPCPDTRIGGHRGPSEFRRDVLRVDGIADGVPSPVDLRVGTRFCPCSDAMTDSVEMREQCWLREPRGPGLPAWGDCRPLDLEDYDWPGEPTNWRWTTTELAANPNDLFTTTWSAIGPAEEISVPFGQPYSRSDGRVIPFGFQSDAVLRWGVGADLTRWSTDHGETHPTGVGASIRGVLWSHTPGPPGAPNLSRAARQPLSHFWSGAFPTGGGVDVRAPVPCIAPIAPYVRPEGLCPWCGGVFPSPWISIELGAPCPELPDFSTSVAQPWLQIGPDLLDDSIPDFVIPAVFEVEGSGRFVAASEVGTYVPSTGPLYVRVGSEGLESVISSDGGGLELTSLEIESTPRTSFIETAIVVLSAERQEVFLLGAETSLKGPRNQVAFARLSEQEPTWRVLHRSPAHERDVLAGGFDRGRDILWVLEGDQGSVYLSAVDPDTGNTVTHTQWRRDAVGTVTRFSLSVDDLGGLYVAASTDTPEEMVVLRIDADLQGQLRQTGITRVSDAVLARDGLRASGFGVTAFDIGTGANPVALRRHEFDSANTCSDCF